MRRFRQWCDVTHKHGLIECDDGPLMLLADHEAMVADLLAALKALRDAVVVHGVTEGEGSAWAAAFHALMSAMQSANATIDKAEGRTA